MRKVKLNVQCNIPSWNFCNYDGFTADDRYSKELCRFCVKTKAGHHCMLFDQGLTTDPRFVHKTAGCIKATATSGYEIITQAQEPTTPHVDPRAIATATLKSYKKLVADLMKQKFPRDLAESIATQELIGKK